MARLARAVIPGIPYHITHRGIRGCNVFLDNRDREFYLHRLKEAIAHFSVRLYSYSLMTNHVHLIAQPERANSLAKAIHDVQGAYAQRFNSKHGLNGPLWHGRFYSCALDERHMWAAVRYVERNPVRAGLVSRAEDYPWSSAAAHCNLRTDDILDWRWLSESGIKDWSAWLSIEDVDATQRIRERTLSGRPCGTDGFVQLIETRLGRRLSPLKRGPKPKARVEEGSDPTLFDLRKGD